MLERETAHVQPDGALSHNQSERSEHEQIQTVIAYHLAPVRSAPIFTSQQARWPGGQDTSPAVAIIRRESHSIVLLSGCWRGQSQALNSL